MPLRCTYYSCAGHRRSVKRATACVAATALTVLLLLPSVLAISMVLEGYSLWVATKSAMTGAKKRKVLARGGVGGGGT